LKDREILDAGFFDSEWRVVFEGEEAKVQKP